MPTSIRTRNQINVLLGDLGIIDKYICVKRFSLVSHELTNLIVPRNERYHDKFTFSFDIGWGEVESRFIEFLRLAALNN